MSFNAILAKRVVNTIVKDGKSLTVSVATETTLWKRTDSAAEAVGAVLEKSLENYGAPLPTDTQEVCSRESSHTSEADKREHITVVCFNSKGEGTSVHIPVKK